VHAEAISKLQGQRKSSVGQKRENLNPFSPTEKLSIELEKIGKAQLAKEVGAGLNTVKVAS
jgi:hypothetical protein